MRFIKEEFQKKVKNNNENDNLINSLSNLNTSSNLIPTNKNSSIYNKKKREDMKIKDIKRQNITNISNNIYGDMEMNNKNIKINPILLKKSKKPSNIKLKIIGNNLNNLSKNKNVKLIKPKQMNNKNINTNQILVNKSKNPSNVKLKIIGNNLSKNKNVKLIKPKQKNIQISPNNSKLKSYSGVFKKSTDISHQNLENYQGQVKSNKSHFKKDYIGIQNLSPNFGNNIEGKINKIKIMNIHSNIKKENNINSNHIITNKIPRIDANAAFNNIQKRVFKYILKAHGCPPIVYFLHK